ncbi:hypothetical protein BJX64DRAFT_274911 [Aspergillus heterothallicus]
MLEAVSQGIDPVLLEEPDSARAEPLAEGQQALVDSVGNRRLAGGLYKREFKTYSREERLHAIEFYRTHVHVNPQTGEERPISTSTAAEILHITKHTLQRWIEEEEKIIGMKEGSSRADGERYSTITISERFKSGRYPFLKLVPAQLFAKNCIAGADFYKLHPLTHPVPFIGIEGGRRGQLETFEDAYEFLGHPKNSSHDGHPNEPAPANAQIHPSPNHTMAAPLEGSPTKEPVQKKPTVQEVNSMLYENAPNYNLRQPSARKWDPCYEKMGTCVGLICQQLLTASAKLESANPVRVGLDYDQPFQGAPAHWAVTLLLTTGAVIVLPMSLCLRGTVGNEVVPDSLFLQGWTIDHEILRCRPPKRIRDDDRQNAIRYSKILYGESKQIFDKFRLSPVLYIEDVEMLFKRSQSWRPRRFSPTWTLYSTILHSSYRSGNTLSPSYGRYSDIELLVEDIIEKAPRAFFSVPPTRSFQLISLAEFELQSRVAEGDIIGLFSRHLEDNDEEIRGTLSLSVLDEILEFDTDSTGEKEFRKKLMRSLKLCAQKTEGLVNCKETCMFFTCPEPQEQPSSYYCHHHSTTLIAHVLKQTESLATPSPRADLVASSDLHLTEHTRNILQQLQTLFTQPERTWIIDFEYVSMPKRYSPIPLQLAIRQLDGKLLYSGNVHYGLSLKEFTDATSVFVSQKHGMMGTLFLRCYGGLRTNGETPPQIKDHIINVCAYDQTKINVLSWFAAQDMQCFLRIITGDSQLIQEKVSHRDASNFQVINIGELCRKLLPNLCSSQLRSVNEYLNGTVSKGKYHTASYDTEVLAQIVKALVKLI